MPLHMINNVSVPETFDLPNRPSLAEKKADEALFDEALALIKEKNALLIAHYYLKFLHNVFHQFYPM